MAILRETEQIYDLLGPICFDDGKGHAGLGQEDYEPHWVARPVGWDSDEMEIYISGDPSTPAADSLARAISAFNSVEKIEKEGRDLIRPKLMSASSTDFPITHFEADLYWLDCLQPITLARFRWEGFAYLSWQATLNETNDIVDLQDIFS